MSKSIKMVIKTIFFMIISVALMQTDFCAKSREIEFIQKDGHNQYAHVDLDGDGRNELIELHEDNDDRKSVSINGKEIIPYKHCTYFIIDLYKDDKYKEIYWFGGNHGGVYRWNGVTLQDYCSWTSKGWGWRGKRVKAFFKKAKKDPNIGNFIICGDRTISSHCLIQAPGATGELRNGFSFLIKYKVKKGKISLVKQKEYKNSTEYYWETRIRGLDSGQPWVAYRYPRLTNNSKVFSVKPGAKYHTVSVRFGDTYTYIKIKKKNKKIGWLIFKTNDLEIL